MKIAFFGTGDFSRNTLQGIIDNKDITVSLVVSQPDKPVGRKKEILPTPVKSLALQYNIPVLQPNKLRENIDFFQTLKKEELDFIVVVAYGKIVPNEVLGAPKHGCINIHGSILPAYRGASPIQESIKNGDLKTGLTIMYMSEGMDEGDILKVERVSINFDDKTQDIFNKFEAIGPQLLISTLKGVLIGDIIGKKQDNSLASYCNKITKKDGQVDFHTQSAQDIYNTFRAYSPWPGIYNFYNGKKFSIEKCSLNPLELELDEDFKLGDIIELEGGGKHQIGIICNPGILILEQIKLEGKKTMDINSFINGNKNFINYTF